MKAYALTVHPATGPVTAPPRADAETSDLGYTDWTAHTFLRGEGNGVLVVWERDVPSDEAGKTLDWVPGARRDFREGGVG